MQPLQGIDVHAFVEEAVSVSAAFLGVIHGGVGVLHQALDRCPVLRVKGDADGEGGAQLLAVDVEGLAQAIKDFFGGPCCVVGRVHAGEDDQEFIPPLPADGVRLADAAGQAQCNSLQELVAHHVAEGVVDGLETVEVEEQQGDALAVAGGAGEGLFETIVEQGAVGQAGQGVVLGQEGDARLGGLALGDVGENRHVVSDALGLVAHDADRQGRGVERAVLAPVVDFALPEAVGVDVPPHGFVEVMLMDAGLEQAGGGSDGFLGGVTGDFGEGPVDRQDALSCVGDDDCLDAVAEHGPGQPQLFFAVPPGGDVGEGGHHGARCFGVFLEERDRVGPQPAPGAVLAVDAQGACLGAPRCQRLHGRNLLDVGRLFAFGEVGDEAVVHVPVAHLLFAQTQDLGGCRVVHEEYAMGIAHDHAFAHRGEQGAHACFPFAQLGLGVASVGDVEAGTDVAGKLAGLVVDGPSGVDDPAVLAVVPLQPVFHLERSPDCEMLQVGADAAIEVFCVDAQGPSVADLLLQAAAGELQPGLVEVAALGVRIGTPDQGGKALEQGEREIPDVAACGDGRGSHGDVGGRGW